jgi:hypothetical protein
MQLQNIYPAKEYKVKPILVGDCNNYSFDTNSCTKCGRSMPDMCIDFEDMKRKAEAYDKLDRNSSSTSDTSVPDKRTARPSLPSDVEEKGKVDPYVAKAATRKGRPRK